MLNLFRVSSVYNPWLLELPEFAVIYAIWKSVVFNSSDLPSLTMRAA